VLRVKGGEVREEHSFIGEIFGDGGVVGDAGNGSEVHGGLLLEEFKGGIELAAD